MAITPSIARSPNRPDGLSVHWTTAIAITSTINTPRSALTITYDRKIQELLRRNANAYAPGNPEYSSVIALVRGWVRGPTTLTLCS